MTLEEIRAAADRELIENPPPPLTDRQVVNLRVILGLGVPTKLPQLTNNPDDLE